MKKKGLLILPLTMMLIIAVALSTATYAWFAVSADAKISTLTVQTSGSDGLQIASNYNSTYYSGSMNLDGNRRWIGSTPGQYGPELAFTTAMASAYGVTGDGLPANMYTAASRSATSFLTTATDSAWYDAKTTEELVGLTYYSNSNGTNLAAGANFQGGQYSGLEDEPGEEGVKHKRTVITTGNGGGPFYIRTQAYPTTQITSANAASYETDSPLFYTDVYGLELANGTGFTNGVWQQTSTLWADVQTFGGSIYVRAIETPADVELSWSYEANNNALDGGQDPFFLIPAVANADYFVLNFSLQSQRGMVLTTERQNVADIFLKKLTVGATGEMAAATRIAIFAQNQAFNSPTLLQYYIPFSKSAWNTTAWTNDLATPQISYKLQGSAVMEGDGFAYGAAGSADLDDDKIIYDETLIYSDGQLQSAKFYGDGLGDIIDKNLMWATKGDFEDAQADPRTRLNSLGEFTSKNAVLYYQLVIWFEGTDAECVSTYAGTGITVDLAFDYYQRWIA